MLLKGKKALITGCNKGIGKSIFEKFIENEGEIIACVRKKSNEFEEFVNSKKKDHSIFIYEIDFSDQNSIKNVSNQIIKAHPKIDILVNNAGSIFNGLFQMTPIDQAKDLFQINFFSQILFTQIILKSILRNKKGSIINITSTAGIDSGEGRSLYNSTKAAMISQTKSLSKEIGRFNIRVNSVAPGLTDTEMMRNNTKEDVIDKVVKNQSLQRIGKPIDIANATLFLASDLSEFITGQIIRVDGGMN